MQSLYLGLLIATIVVVLTYVLMNKDNFEAYSGDDPVAVYSQKAAAGLGVKEIDDAEYPNNRQPTEYEKLWYTKGHHAAIQKEVLDSMEDIETLEKSVDNLTTRFTSFQTETREKFNAYGKSLDDFKTATTSNFAKYDGKFNTLESSLDSRFKTVTDSIASNVAQYEEAFNKIKENASVNMDAVNEEIENLKEDNATLQAALNALKITQAKMEKAYAALGTKQADIDKKQRDLETVKATTSVTPLEVTDEESD
tara:strand:- start:2379 stop:3137 length:759 start_codon:yes stop_codon:yes gene_type:complete